MCGHHSQAPGGGKGLVGRVIKNQASSAVVSVGCLVPKLDPKQGFWQVPHGKE